MGGKPANLSRLARLNHRRPDGFSIPVTVMDEIDPSDLRADIPAAVADLMRCHRLPSLAAVRARTD